MSLDSLQTLSPERIAGASTGQRQQMLRQAVNELVGSTFYAEMLKMSRANPFKGKFGHGGRGEEVFGAQLDQELARRAGAASNSKMTDAIYKRLGGEA